MLAEDPFGGAVTAALQREQPWSDRAKMQPGCGRRQVCAPKPARHRVVPVAIGGESIVQAPTGAARIDKSADSFENGMAGTRPKHWQPLLERARRDRASFIDRHDIDRLC